MDLTLNEIERYLNIFDVVLDNIGPAALENDETRRRLLTRFENILVRYHYAVPIIRQIVQIVRGVIQFIRFGQRLYELFRSTINRLFANGSRALPY